jgi:hypothetical protein
MLAGRASCSVLLEANLLAKKTFLKAAKAPRWNGRNGAAKSACGTDLVATQIR